MNSSIIIAAIVAFALTFLTGLILFIRGLRGRWLDSHPYCRKCRYNLTGQTSEKCPECGMELSGDTVAFRIRKRRRISLTFGGIILSIIFLTIAPLGIGSVRAKLSNPKRYEYYPLSVLLYFAERDDAAAFDELFRRHDKDLYSQEQARSIVERAISSHEKQTKPPAVLTPLVPPCVLPNQHAFAYEAWADLIMELNDMIALTPLQRDRFFSNVAGDPNVKIRPKMVFGNELTYSVQWQMKGSNQLVCREISTIGVDGKERTLHGPPIHLPTHAGGNMTSRIMLRPQLEPGTHRIEIITRQSFRTAANDAEADSAMQEMMNDSSQPDYLQVAARLDKVVPPLWSRTVSQFVEVEVLPESEKNSAKLILNDDTVTDWKAGINCEITAVAVDEKNSFLEEPYLLVTVNMNFRPRLDRCLAFKVSALAGGRGMDLGTMTIHPNVDARIGYSLRALDTEPPAVQFDKIILRSSADAAELTTDCFEIPDIELEYGPIEIKRSNNP